MKNAIDSSKVIKNYLITAKENIFIVRLLSFIMAVVFSLIILFNPHFIASSPEAIKHGLLSLQMSAICAAFIHGIGFSAENVYFRLLLSPFLHWPVMFTLCL